MDNSMNPVSTNGIVLYQIMNCRNCGAEMDQNAAICVKCGYAKGKSFCQNCGAPTSEGQSMCTNCGFALANASCLGSVPVTPDAALKSVMDKFNTSYIIWLVVGICQIVFGFWYVAPVIFGIWNIIAANSRKKLIQQYKYNPAGLIETVKSWENNMIVMIILNVLLGALIGIAGGIYDYTIISYVKQHEQKLAEVGA